MPFVSGKEPLLVCIRFWARVRRARSHSPARAKHARRRMLALATDDITTGVAITWLSSVPGYREGCGTAGDSDAAAPDARPVGTNIDSCLAPAIFTHPARTITAIAKVAHRRLTGAGVVRTGITKPRTIPASRPPR